MALHPHLSVAREAQSQRFTSPLSGPRERIALPPRGRAAHAQHLLNQLQQIRPVAQQRAAEQRALGIDDGLGIYLIFESAPDFELKFESLDVAKSGIELCAVRQLADGKTQATVFIPDGKLGFFLKRFVAYRDENTKPRRAQTPSRPKNQDLAESISDIKLAALEALWTDDPQLFPAPDAIVIWEVWLRRGRGTDQLARLRNHAATFHLEIGQKSIKFIDRTIVLVRASAVDLARSIDLLGAIAELRLAKTTASLFTDMTAIEQQAWVDDLVQRLDPPSENPPFVCLFDTGINHAHPLFEHTINANDLHTYNPGWGSDDRQGHGTPMAGLAAMGDLTEPLASGQRIKLTHHLESVKIINANDPHEKELYGAVTQESAYRVEVSPNRRRVFCMAITATDGRERGAPSSWSAAVDALATGMDGGPRRLFVLSAGNTDENHRRNYPNSNFTDGIHDPAQAWNALTVGGCTEKITIDGAKYPGWSPFAPLGDLSPCSCTSTTWSRTKWPIKPDIVLEAGNMAIHPDYEEPDYIDTGLQLLSTSHDFARAKPLTSFGDTSAATALAAHMAAAVSAKYPAFTPETIRALMVHAADWTPAMRRRFTDAAGNLDYEGLLRCYGYGIPNLRRLLSSADNSLTLISQASIRPFFKDHGRIKTREMRLHPLPWPVDVLRDLQNAPVTMRVTLSHFIEPSPGARGWTSKYGYQSFGLRFAVKQPLETPAQFEKRINKFVREADYDNPGLQDTGNWLFGYARRSLTSLGSIHSDVWSGTAADLAARGHIAVYPTFGWWNKRGHLGAWNKEAYYSLLVTIETPDQAVDIYTPVANEIGVPVVIET